MTATELKAALFAADDRRIERVETPEWAPNLPCVWVRSLSGDELGKLGGLDDSGRELVVGAGMALCDEEGTPLGFSEAELVLLGGKSAGVLKRVYDRAMILTGLREDPAKNSATSGAAGG